MARVLRPTAVGVAIASTILCDRFGSSAATSNGTAATTTARLTAITCVANAGSPAVFYGQLAQLRFLDEQPSMVQIFPTTDVSEFYFQILAERLQGVVPTAPPNVDGIVYGQQRLNQTLAAVELQGNASRAIVTRKGTWACRGFSPGRYSFLATAHVLVKAPAGGSQDTIVTQYYRADATVADTTKATVLVPVAPFRLIGQSPQ